MRTDVPELEDAQQAILIARAPAAVATDTPREEETDEETAGSHVVFADQTGLAEELLAELRDAGERAIEVRLGNEFSGAEDQFVVSPTSDDDLKQLFDAVGPLATVTHCGGLDQPRANELSIDSLRESQQLGVMHALRLARVLATLELASIPRVVFVTRDTQVVVDDDQGMGLASAPLVGLARVANSEHTPFHWTVVDLPRERDGHHVEALRDELLVGDAELEIAYRGPHRYTNRLHRVRPHELPKRQQSAVAADGRVIPYRLQIDKPGVLTNLSLNETDRIAPEPTEIEVEMAAGGINFRDVMKALGMYPGNPVDVKWFGDDFAGTVTRVGDQVTQFAVGDRVAGMSPYCFRTYARSDYRTALKIPDNMPFVGAATLPTVFLTAHYAINHLARMERGESILIHAAAGGVGQAAIQIAQHQGLEVFATAGTDEKRQLIREMGVQHIMNSRTLDFADEIMEITGGRGVDAVLNSLAGPFLPKNASVLAPFGRFLEIGKIDVYGNTKIGLETLKDNISYFIIDLAQALEHKRDLVGRIFAELADRFAAGDYRPLSHTVFPISDVVEAFRFMAQGKHIGKNVLDFETDKASITIGPCTQAGKLFPADATYLISGGASGFGLEVVKWMARNGARHLVLMSRSGPRDPQAQADIKQLQADGVQVIDARGDVTKQADVRRVVQEIKDNLPPLKGVLHGAMVLEDCFIEEMTEECFTKVMNPKMLGAWNLHTETLDCPLEHFIGFSSFSSVVGAAKQGNYNAGNVFLDQLAAYRQRQGLPALTYNWGGISGAGFVHRNATITQ
ncbi:MAG: SDR family NAD(P)-dependent oxidoreductase, partial [Planctomycetota bacterium]